MNPSKFPEALPWHELSVTVCGLGRSGVAAAKALMARQAHLVLSDARPLEELPEELRAWPSEQVRVDAGGHSRACLDGDVVVISPGVPIDLPILQAAMADGVPVLGEVELAYRLRPEVPVVAITGTNGKTTTTALTAAILAEGGLVAPACGNIGVPYVGVIDQVPQADAYVVEISSFQLEAVDAFRPRAAAFLNFSDDHLNRHGTREVYLETKARIFRRQQGDDVSLLNADDPVVAALAGSLASNVRYFSGRRPVGWGVGVEEGWLRVFEGGVGQDLMPLEEIQLKGAHNLENVAAACGLALAMGVAPGAIRRAVGAFGGVEHRIEPVATIEGVAFVNDSKGTNYDASLKAMEAYEGSPLILMAGGRDKGGHIKAWADGVVQRCKAVVLFGEAAPYFERVLKEAGASKLLLAGDLKEAVRLAHAEAEAGEVVLFSPACTSFDMFNNFEERGRAYKTLVHELAGGAGSASA